MAINLVNIEEYIIERIKEINPNANVAPGSALRDLLVSPLVSIMQPLANEIQRIKKNQSLLNAENMSDEDVDALLANLFISRKSGSKATGIAKVVLRSPVSTTIPAGTIFVGGNGLQFFSIHTVYSSSQSLVPNPSTGRYELSVDVEARSPGAEFNISKNSITSIISSNPNIIGATNASAFSGGTDSENNTTLVSRASSSIGSRTLATQRGAEQIISDSFDSVQKVNVVGFGDDEMIRDKIYAPSLTIDGIQYPQSVGAHMGGKIDIYVITGITENTVTLSNSGEGSVIGKGDNIIGLYSGTGEGIQFENTLDGAGALCEETSKPIVDIIGVSIDEATQSTPEYASVAILEDTDFVFSSVSPGKSNSVNEKKQLMFVRGAGLIDNVYYNPSYVDVYGQYYDFGGVSSGEFLSFIDIRNGPPLHIMGATLEEIESLQLINYEKSIAGIGSLDLSPSKGVTTITTVNNTFQLLRNVHVTTGRDGEAITPIMAPKAGVHTFTICGWLNLRSLPPESSGGAIPKRTVFNINGSVSHESGVSFNEAQREDILHIYVDKDGRFNFYTRGLSGAIVENRTSALPDGDRIIDTSSDLDDDNWVFVAFTYNSLLQRKEMFYGRSNDSDIKYAIWEGSSSNPGVDELDYDDFGTQMTVGTVDNGEYEIYLSENRPEFSETGIVQVWDGLIDGVQIYEQALSYTQLNEIFKNDNTATITGLEKTKIPDATKSIWNSQAGLGSHPVLFGGIIQLLDGAAAGSKYQIVSNTQPFNPDDAMSLTVRSYGGAPVNRLSSGDKYALLPRIVEYEKGASPVITNLAGDLVPVGGGANIGDEEKIGVGLEMSYYHAPQIEDIQDFVDLNELRPANVDILVKHGMPIFISGEIKYKSTKVVTEEEAISAIKSYITSRESGSEFQVSGLISHMFAIGIDYMELPLELTFTYRDVWFQKNIKEDVEDKFAASKNQYFLPGDIVVSQI